MSNESQDTAPQSEQTKMNPLLVPLFDELSGERVILRPYQETDAAGLHDAVDESREHLRPWLPFYNQHNSVDEALSWIISAKARWLLRESMNCALIEAATGRYLGGIGLHVHSWEIPYFEIGYWLRKSAEGHGYITEAARLLTDFALNNLRAKRVEIRCDELNTASANVARRLGYLEEGCFRNDFQSPEGAVRNTLVFSRIPGETRNEK
ncbi:MAG: GNAT family N-acetyltransferase [Chloroflexota bacterium]